MEALSIGLAGAFGALCRWQVGVLANKFLGDDLPWGTLTVNVVGSLLLALVLELAAGDRIPPHIKTPIATGCLGAFTTFSTFSNDTLTLLADNRLGLAVGNVLLNVTLGLAAAWLGMWLARAV